MDSKFDSFLLPLCHAGGCVSTLEKVGADPIFDRNVIGLVVQFAKEFNPCFLRKWGVRGKTPGQLEYPRGGGVAVHSELDLVFVADSHNNRIQSFRSDGTAVKQWGSHGAATGEFQYPHGVAVLDRSQDRGHLTPNCVFITDAFNGRIQVFGVDGSFILKWGSRGKNDGQLYDSYGIAVLQKQHPTQSLVYVTDYSNHRVQVFGPDGTFIRKWGVLGTGDGQFTHPWGVAVHPTRDLVYISEAQGHRIQAFRRDGSFLFKWGIEGSEDGQFCSPRQLALHPTYNLLFVSDSHNDRVQVFDLNGSFVCKWGSYGYFDCPWGVGIHPTKNIVYVSDDRGVQEFSLFRKDRKCKKV